MDKKKVIRITTVPISLFALLEGQLKMLNKFYNVIAVSSAGPLQKVVAEREGVQCFSVEMTRKISPLQDIMAVYQLYKLFKKEKPFVVHTHTPKAGIAGMIAARLANVPNRLHTVGGLPLIIEKGLKYKLLYYVEKITFACATKVFPISLGIKDYIISTKLCPPQKLKVILDGSSNGIDIEYFSKVTVDQAIITEHREKLKITETDFVFLFVGRLVGDKGINELVTAFANLAKRNSSLKLLLVGPYEEDLDPLKNEVLQEIDENRNILIVGFQKDVRSFYAIADAFIFPSYREGFGNVVAQAGAMELPCVVSDITGCNEIIKDGLNGLIVPSKSSITLEKAMDRLVSDRNLYTKLKLNSREEIVRRYDQKEFWNAMVEEYKKLETSV